MKEYTDIDRLLIKSNDILNTIFNIKRSGRKYPAANIEESENMTDSNARLVNNLMRVNHAGEIAAQGLYIGHALLAKTEDQKNDASNGVRGERSSRLV